MQRRLTTTLLFFLCALVAPFAVADGQATKPPADSPTSQQRFMVSVTLHKQKEIRSLLTRADELSKTMRGQGNDSSIALILHGDEIRFFANSNYKQNRDIVDRAARLDGDKVIEIKVCKTKLHELGISDKEMPSFVEIIPYAPDEEKRLLKQGYIYM